MEESLQKYLAEAIATFSLVFIGAGVVIMDSVTGSVGLLGVAVAHGLVLMTMVYATMNISGGHVNPAVSIAMVVSKQMKAIKGFYYVVSQLIGAAVAGFLLLAIFPTAPANLGVTDLASSVDPTTGILIEAVLTFFLVFVIFGVAVDKRANPAYTGAAIGLVLTFDILFGGLLTGAAMNPARAFGPAIASGYWATQLVYWIGPIVGGIIAALIYSKFLMEK